MRTFFSSDHHFGHANIIRYCGRPYASVGEMNFDLTRRWNEVVAPGDQVWYLGDFAMGDRATWPNYVAGLNGRIALVLGNHDAAKETMLEVGFDDVFDNVVVEVEGRRLWLNHYPPEQKTGQTIEAAARSCVPKPPHRTTSRYAVMSTKSGPFARALSTLESTAGGSIPFHSTRFSPYLNRLALDAKCGVKSVLAQRAAAQCGDRIRPQSRNPRLLELDARHCRLPNRRLI